MNENCPSCKVRKGHRAGCPLADVESKRTDISLEAYHQFLREKCAIPQDFGVAVEPSDIHPWLKPHQRVAVQWAVRGGRRALFESFGLGKTVQQLEILRLILKHAGGRGLIVAPLGVRQEFLHDAFQVGIDLQFIRSIEEAAQPVPAIYLTNYETVRDGKLDPKHFTVTSLDEASILRSFGGTKTFREFMRLFETVPYRFVATATPDPNEYIELLAYAAYLGIMDVSQAKTRFFKRDSTKADKLTLHAHKEKEFWLWCSSWALFLRKPSDLGESYTDEGYDLPPFEVIKHEIPVDHTDATPERDGQGRMFREAKHGVVDAAREKRETLVARISKAAKIVAESPGEHFLLWHDLEAERKEIEKQIPGVVSVYGAQRANDAEALEQAIADFSQGRIPLLALKPSMFGSGSNFQYHCSRAIFCGIGFKFNDFVQGLHRILRFLQSKPVQIHLIYAESERTILQILMEKWERHKLQTERMAQIILEYGLSQAAIGAALGRSMGIERQVYEGRGSHLVNADCVEEIQSMPSDSAHLILTSIPFSTQYEYTPCYDEQTEVLTRRGWLSFGQLLMDDMIATVNPDTLEFEWQTPSRRIWQPYSGKMLRFESRDSFDLLVTPNHRMFVDTRLGNKQTGRIDPIFSFVEASVMAEAFANRKWRMLATAPPSTSVILEFVFYPRARQRTMPNSKTDRRIKVRDFMRLAGWYLSEGSCRPSRGEITISQSSTANPQNCVEISELFSRLGLPSRNDGKAITASNVDLSTFLVNTFGAGSHSKEIPRWVKDLHPKHLCILRDTMMKGDGTKTGFAYTSFSPRLRNDFQEICFVTGWRTCVSGDVVRIGQKHIFPEVRNKPQEHDYTGMIGCVSVPNRTVVVRRHGAAIVSGNSYNDFGHTDSNEHFFEQMEFLIPHLLRVLKPGRLAAIHVKDRVVPGGITGLGFQVVYPFHAECIRHFSRHGFAYMGMKTIVTDVVRENNQTYRLGWTEQCKDGSKMGFGMPEYLLLFRKPPTDTTNSYADEPVVKSKAEYTRSRWQIDAHSFTRSDGNRPLMPADLEGVSHATIFKLFRKYSLEQVYNFEHHVKLGEVLESKRILPVTFMLLQPQSWHPDVWSDITRMRTLNAAQSAKGREMHLCPLQFDIADRAIAQWTMPGETVFDPFGGLFTVPLCAVKLGRQAVSIELNPGYFYDGCNYVRAAELKASTPTLFDLLDTEEATIEEVRE